jgi:hypothetical protein
MAWSVMMGAVARETSPISPRVSGPARPWRSGRGCTDAPRYVAPGSLTQPVKRRATPKFFLVDAMTAFHLPILFGPARLDMPETDASCLHGEGKGQWEFCAIVHLYLANGKREHCDGSWPETRDWCRDTCGDRGARRDTACSHRGPCTENISGRRLSPPSHRPAHTRRGALC